jgi:hypothetical protein
MASSVRHVAGRDGRPGGGPGDCGPFPAVRASAVQAGARHTGRPGQAKMFPAGPRRQGSAGEAGTESRWPAPGKDLWPARGERSERPVAGTSQAAQADKAGEGQTQTRRHRRQPGSRLSHARKPEPGRLRASDQAARRSSPAAARLVLPERLAVTADQAGGNGTHGDEQPCRRGTNPSLARQPGDKNPGKDLTGWAAYSHRDRQGGPASALEECPLRTVSTLDGAHALKERQSSLPIPRG